MYDFNDLFFLNNNLGYIVGEGGAVKKTIDGGVSFTNVNTGTIKALYSVFFLDANTGWVCGDEGVVFKTINGGTNWTPQTLPTFTMSLTLFSQMH